MFIIGANYHPGFQQIAFVDAETGQTPAGGRTGYVSATIACVDAKRA